MSSSPASSKAENASADKISAHCKFFTSRFFRYFRENASFVFHYAENQNVPCNCNIQLHIHLPINETSECVNYLTNKAPTIWYLWGFFTCKNVAEATEESILRKWRDNLSFYWYPLIYIIDGLCSSWYICCVQLQINTSKLQLKKWNNHNHYQDTHHWNVLILWRSITKHENRQWI